jgi:hypothetical protein
MDTAFLIGGVLLVTLGVACALNVRGFNDRWMRLPWPIAMIPRSHLMYRATGVAVCAIGLVWIAVVIAHHA